MSILTLFLAWTFLSLVVGWLWSAWYEPRGRRPPDQWRRYRGIAKLRAPASDELDLSALRKRR
jgi:hypothetical protein